MLNRSIGKLMCFHRIPISHPDIFCCAVLKHGSEGPPSQAFFTLAPAALSPYNEANRNLRGLDATDKVIVIGSPGAGKSVFSRQLREKTGLPLIHLDMVWHKPDKTHISRDEFDQFLLKCFQERQWILDGNYSRTLEARFRHADTVFLLDYPVEICLDGIRQRIGQPRSDMPWIEGFLDAELVQIVREYPTIQRKKVYELIRRYHMCRNIIIFQSRDEATQYLDGLSPSL